MTTNSDFDRHAAAFLADGPTQLADRVLDAALTEVHLTRQRRGLAALWRFPRMNAFFRLQAAALVAVVLLGGALVFIAPRLGPGGTLATPAPTPTGTAACGHELGQGLYLTAGCTYRTSGIQPTLSIVSDGSWLDTFQTPNALDFVAMSGPGLNTYLRLRPLRSVLADACAMGSGERRPSTPSTASAYLDWLSLSVVEPTNAVPAELLGLQGWRFDFGGDGKQTFDPEDPCAFVSLSEPSADATNGSAETVAVDRTQPVHVYVLDSSSGVLLVMLWTTDAEGSAAAGESFLAGMHVAP